MSNPTCLYAACERTGKYKGWCDKHRTIKGYLYSRLTNTDNEYLCWDWTEGTGGGGYGATTRTPSRAHALAYELFIGAIPDGLFVCHRCDRPLCCNPAHLFLDTSDGNQKDRAAKGRTRKDQGVLDVAERVAISLQASQDRADNPPPSGPHPIYTEWWPEWSLNLSGRLSPASVPVYERALRQFTGRLDPDKSVVDVTRQDVDAWMAHLSDQGLSAATRDVRLKALSLFFKYVSEEENITNPVDRVQRVRVEAPVIYVPSDEEIRAVLHTCDSRKAIDRRDALLIRLLSDAGLRRAESTGIDLDDIDFTACEALVHGKGGKDRVVAFGPATAAAGMKWLRARREWAPDDEPALFVTASGTRMAPTNIPTMLSRRCARAGVEPIHPHALRHRATHSLLEAGLGEQMVEHQMGWSGGQMIRRYGKSLAGQRSRDAVRRARKMDL